LVDEVGNFRKQRLPAVNTSSRTTFSISISNLLLKNCGSTFMGKNRKSVVFNPEL